MELRELYEICKQAEFKNKDINKAFERAITPRKVGAIITWAETCEKRIAQLEMKLNLEKEPNA